MKLSNPLFKPLLNLLIYSDFQLNINRHRQVLNVYMQQATSRIKFPININIDDSQKLNTSNLKPILHYKNEWKILKWSSTGPPEEVWFWVIPLKMSAWYGWIIFHLDTIEYIKYIDSKLPEQWFIRKSARSPRPPVEFYSLFHCIKKIWEILGYKSRSFNSIKCLEKSKF